MCGVRPRQALYPYRIPCMCMSIATSGDLVLTTCAGLESNWIAFLPRAGFLCNGFRTDMDIGR
jgi:hypothetical protein